MSVEVITMGCRLNGYESGVIQENLTQANLTDVIVINSCAVTAEAVRQAKQTIRKLGREQPHKKIIVTGCAAQTEPETFANMTEVAKVLGNHEKLLPESFKNLLTTEDTEKIHVNDIMSVKETAGHLMSAFDDKARVYLQIQNGCDHRCTFCIIPFGRGNSRSVPAGVVVEQVKQAVARGIHEIVLTGVDITSWGSDLPAQPRLGRLVGQILKLVPDLPRLRLSSIDSIETDPELFEIIVHEKRFMPHLHLSLQSGDNMILKRMKRRHNREQSIEYCLSLKEKRPDMAFGADIIAGFPTETDEMFDNTARLLTDINIVYAHIFPFSPRIGTPASKMPQIEKKIIKERASILRKIGTANHDTYLKSLVGTSHHVIAEGHGFARTPSFARVSLHQNVPSGSLHHVYMRDYKDNMLFADIIA